MRREKVRRAMKKFNIKANNWFEATQERAR